MDVDKLSLLAEPFQPNEVKFKPSVVSGGRALAMAYIDARAVMDRLDEVVGPMNWKDSYKVLDNGDVVCKLSVYIDGQWVSKMDVGNSGDSQKDDAMKGAFSDALKRAAVKFGIGRYLYRFPNQWVDYDAQKRKFINQPKLPDFAMPKSRQPMKPAYEEDPHPVVLLDEQQAEQIWRLLDELKKAGKLDSSKFFGWISTQAGRNIRAVSQIPADQFQTVLTTLNNKLKVAS